MEIFLWIIACIVFFGAGLISAFVLQAFMLAMQAKDKTGVWLTYSPKKDQWEMNGDLAHCFSKARLHHKGIKPRLS
ncbi:hypothetical protein HOS16_gp43 [Shigella phage vB_SflS-ISF001]|uniref:Uncharacterized protein n=1 Tax=Shigella phage vB_SflS-ISF001 TaxID=2048005 RepID=A0A2D1GQB4_9CAUD|nr:hypothetical protein HOS16_gp43 [Shigella phage vB_SflS-ISF001]ATN94121.1 hypothetical protein FLXISF001_043 [Shigella phage vB_SflS-ISF001]